MANINGTNGANNINGTALADRIDAKGGHDTISAGAGNDTIYGGNGNDLISGGTGNDLIDGGAGIDTASYAGAAGAVTVNLGTGAASGADGIDTLVSIENVTGSNWADLITGSAGANFLSGGGGSDTFFVSGGIDTIDGGLGNDAIDFAGAANVTASLAAGTYGHAGGSGSFTGIEHLIGGANGDMLTGNAGANKLDGKGGADTMAGGQGDDQLWGGGGSDRLVADGGNDYLVGDYAMFDGFVDNAADTFVIATSAGHVTVSDFNLGVDKLDLTHFGFDQNGNSPYWSGSAAQQGFDTVLTLSGQNGETVTITLQGVVEGHLLTTADMIGGSASLIAPPPVYPVNGGNGLADTFVIDPNNGNVVIDHFENGLDLLDISGFVNNGWGGFLSNLPDGSAVLEFTDGQGHDFTVTLPGFHYAYVDASDFIV